MKQLIPDFSPGLTIVQVGDREDSNVYIRSKIKAATEIGMTATLAKLPRTITEIQVRIYKTIKDRFYLYVTSSQITIKNYASNIQWHLHM